MSDSEGNNSLEESAWDAIPADSESYAQPMSIGALREAIINATELNGVFGQNVHESKDVVLRVGGKDYPLTQVSVGFYPWTGKFVMFLTGEEPDGVHRPS